MTKRLLIDIGIYRLSADITISIDPVPPIGNYSIDYSNDYN